MRHLDRTGIFKAVPAAWTVKSMESGAVAVNLEFTITAQLEGSEWTDWRGYEEHFAFGDFWVVKKDGTINTKSVQQLVAALGWSGDLRHVTGSPPEVEVQVTVKAEEHNGKTYHKVSWINPGNYTPRPEGASDGDVAQLQARFGSLLRAAASAVKPEAVPAPAKRVEAPPSEHVKSAFDGGNDWDTDPVF